MNIRVEISSASALAHLLPLLRLIHLSFVCGCGWLWMHGYCIYHYTTIISELESVPSASAHLPFLRSPFFAPTSVLPPPPTGGSFPGGGGHIDRISPDFPLTLFPFAHIGEGAGPLQWLSLPLFTSSLIQSPRSSFSVIIC